MPGQPHDPAPLGTVPSRRWAAPALLAVGAIAYAVLQGSVGMTFNATPFTIGMVVVVAGVAGGVHRLVPIGLTLIGWGLAVLLVRNGPLPGGREAPAFMIGVSIGLLAAHGYGRRFDISLTGSLVTALAGGASFYAAFDVAEFNKWEWWTGAVGLWAVFEAARLAWTASRRSSP